jgi:uncharacterized repeat protein (TIGR03803 family)
MRSTKSYSGAKSVFVILITLLLTSVIVPTLAQARKFKVLHTFHGANGNGPAGLLTRDAAGNLYGTTEAGGTGKCGNFGCGTAFKLNKSGKQVWLHSFNGADGEQPLAGLLRDGKENLYGTTFLGGDTKCYTYGCGTVFKLDSSGRETLLYKFKGQPDGWFSDALLARDSLGNLYGTARNGGTDDNGIIFKVDKHGKETVLHSFTGGSDGCLPVAGLITDLAGNLYGVTAQGGLGLCDQGYGVVFKLDTANNLTVLYTFGFSDGAYPASVLLLDQAGNLYGTTEGGGNSACGFDGCGVFFELSPQQNGSWTETMLYAFCSVSSCADGEEPVSGPVVRDSTGNIYGTTIDGGTSRNCNGVGCGAVFKIDTSGKESVLYSFTNGADGGFPFAGLIMDRAGNLYGTATGGGNTRCKPNGCGTVFKIVS